MKNQRNNHTCCSQRLPSSSSPMSSVKRRCGAAMPDPTHNGDQHPCRKTRLGLGRACPAPPRLGRYSSQSQHAVMCRPESARCGRRGAALPKLQRFSTEIPESPPDSGESGPGRCPTPTGAPQVVGRHTLSCTHSNRPVRLAACRAGAPWRVLWRRCLLTLVSTSTPQLNSMLRLRPCRVLVLSIRRLRAAAHLIANWRQPGRALAGSAPTAGCRHSTEASTVREHSRPSCTRDNDSLSTT